MHFKTSRSRKIAYFSPLIMLLIGIVMYSYILPARYNKVINLIDWLFSGSDNIIATLRSSSIVLGHAYRILFTKAVVWIWTLGMLFSIYMCGMAVQYRDDDYNDNAKYKGNAWKNVFEEVLLILKSIKNDEMIKDDFKLYNEVHVLREVCDSIGDFGKGNDQKIEIETEIVTELKKMKTMCEKIKSKDDYINHKEQIKEVCKIIRRYIVQRDSI